ncbi:MAG: helix-turn-helix transcriptional regulator [Chitinispirillia bacterium]|nr:helix-turn-helix transcriptional regulator [Chitinispirillia bacterium]
MSLNKRIKEFRKYLGLTQAEFGRRIGIVQGHLTGIESGKKNVTQKTLKVICATYSVSEEWLRTGNGEMIAQNPDKRAIRIIKFFNELSSEFQDYMLLQLQSLLELQKKQTAPPAVHKKKLPDKK